MAVVENNPIGNITLRDTNTPGRPAENWKIRPLISSKTLAILLVISLLLGASARGIRLERLPIMVVQGIGDSMGLVPNSEVGPAIRKLISGLFPFELMEKTDTSRVDNFDPKHLPPFTYVKQEPITEYSAITNKYTVTDTRPYLVDPIGYLKNDLMLMLQTVEVAIWGTLLALILAIPIAYFGTRGYTPNQFTYSVARGICSWTRAVPQLIAALIFVMIFGFGVIPGIVTLAVSTMGFLGKFLADDIENADKGAQEALRSIGANKIKVLRYAVLPQVMPQYLAYLQYTLERNVNAATAIGVVGAGGIGMELKGRWDMYDYGHVSTTLAVIFLTAFALERVTAIVRKKLIA